MRAVDINSILPCPKGCFLSAGKLDNLNPINIWFVPAEKINHLRAVAISKGFEERWSKYTLDITKVLNCCDTMKGDNVEITT